jgi:hypothetical protein
MWPPTQPEPASCSLSLYRVIHSSNRHPHQHPYRPHCLLWHSPIPDHPVHSTVGQGKISHEAWRQPLFSGTLPRRELSHFRW